MSFCGRERLRERARWKVKRATWQPYSQAIENKGASELRKDLKTKSLGVPFPRVLPHNLGVAPKEKPIDLRTIKKNRSVGNDLS